MTLTIIKGRIHIASRVLTEDGFMIFVDITKEDDLLLEEE